MAVRFLGFVVNGVHQEEMPDELAERFWKIYYDVMGYEPVEESEPEDSGCKVNGQVKKAGCVSVLMLGRLSVPQRGQCGNGGIKLI